MPEINPYEAPQLPLAASATPDPPPRWIGDISWLQLEGYVLCGFLSLFTIVPSSHESFNTFFFIVLGITALLSLILFVQAIRYRIGLLIVVELAIALPCLVYLASQPRLHPSWL